MTVERLEQISNEINPGLLNSIRSQLESCPPDEDKFAFTLGADIEGLILKPDGSGYIRAVSTKFNSLSPTAWVGRDGAGDQVEFRFEQSQYPHIAIENFQKSLNIFKNWVLEGNSKGVIFGNFPYSKPCGGHIHFGCKPNEELIKKLDFYLAVPVLLISEPQEFILRCKGSYGKLSNIERKDYGFEYRTLGSFPVNKFLTTEIFVLAGLIVDQYKDLSDVSIDSDFTQNYYSGNKEYFRKNYLSIIEKELLTIGYQRFMNWGWALKHILNFILRVKNGYNFITSRKEVLNMWNLLPNEFKLTYKIIVNNDDFMTELKPVFLQEISNCTKLDADLFIYGAKEERSKKDIEIWVNKPLYENMFFKFGKDVLRELNLSSGNFGKASQYKYTIGLSYKLRKQLVENPNNKSSKKALKLIRRILSCVV